MYESPINRICGEIYDEIIRKDEEHLMTVITQQVGYQVDRDELIKALQYDRNQYKKGYKEGYEEGIEHPRWISCSERLPGENTTIIGTTEFDDIYKAELYDDCGEKKWYADGDFDVPIVAWIPLPPYKADKEKNNER